MTAKFRVFVLAAGLALAACSTGPEPEARPPLAVRTDFPAGSHLAQIDSSEDAVRVRILPEAEPINPSPWYALSLSVESPAETELVLDYGNYRHRYQPWVRRAGGAWEPLANERLVLRNDGHQAAIRLDLAAGEFMLAAQPIVDQAVYESWFRAWLTRSIDLATESAGMSTGGRDVRAFTLLTQSEHSQGPLLIVLGRQHPPEVTGAYALDGFVRAALNHAANDTLPFDLVVLPLLNPDGVALGHWRMNATGVDLNRDWSQRSEAETRLAWAYLEALGMRGRDQVVMIDFHSTHGDRLYVDQYADGDWRADLLDTWLEALGRRGGDGTPEARVTQSAGGNTAKAVFAAEVAALAVTWEAGDNTSPALASAAGANGFQALIEAWEIRSTALSD